MITVFGDGTPSWSPRGLLPIIHCGLWVHLKETMQPEKKEDRTYVAYIIISLGSPTDAVRRTRLQCISRAGPAQCGPSLHALAWSPSHLHLRGECGRSLQYPFLSRFVAHRPENICLLIMWAFTGGMLMKRKRLNYSTVRWHLHKTTRGAGF